MHRYLNKLINFRLPSVASTCCTLFAMVCTVHALNVTHRNCRVRIFDFDGPHSTSICIALLDNNKRTTTHYCLQSILSHLSHVWHLYVWVLACSRRQSQSERIAKFNFRNTYSHTAYVWDDAKQRPSHYSLHFWRRFNLFIIILYTIFSIHSLQFAPENLHAKRMFRFVTNCDTEFMMCECILVENEIIIEKKEHIDSIERISSTDLHVHARWYVGVRRTSRRISRHTIY